MSLRLTRARFLRAAAASGASALPLSAQARGEELFEVTDSETATIDGRDWDTPIMGGRTVDAVHRSVLLRFPDAADTIAILLRKGKILLKAELSLQYDGYEILPAGYTCREGLGQKLWTENPPTWHVQRLAAAPALDRRQGDRPDLQCQRQRPALLGALSAPPTSTAIAGPT